MMKKSKLPPGINSLVSNTFFHGGAFLLALDGGIMNRFTCCFIKNFSDEIMLKAIHDYKPVFYMSGPFHIQALSNMRAGDHDLSSLVCVMPSGGMVTPACVHRLQSLLPSLKMIYQFYGSSEVGGVSWTHDVRDACLGSLSPGVTAYIRNMETGGRMREGEVGEIMVKTGTTMKGYLNNSKATGELYDEEGFVHMGDLGYYDKTGKLFFKDRIKEVIKCQNKWFGPSEVEEMIETIQGVAEACVWVTVMIFQNLFPHFCFIQSTYDVMKCDDIVHVGVVLRRDVTDNIDKKVITDHVRNNLPAHKHITGDIFLLDSIPHNPTGKKLRRVLKSQQKDGKL